MNKYMEKKTKLFFPVKFQFVQSLSCVQLFMTPWTAACQASMSFTLSWSLLKLMSIESVMASNYLILCCPFLLLPLIFPSIGSFPMNQFFASGGQSSQHIKKERHHSANKGPYSQMCGFASNHVWMWELHYEEGWTPKNGCVWTVLLEKTLESPLYREEIKPVHPKGNQSWIFIRRTDAEAETPVLWLPDAKDWFIGKYSDSGKD